MAVHSLTLNLPGSLYEPLIRRAERTHRPVEVVLLEAVATGMSVDEDLPAELAQAVSALHLLDDAELWRAAQSSLPKEVATQIENLHLKRQFAGLTPNETQVLATVMKRYEQTVLVRAQATLLLKERGHDVSQLLDDLAEDQEDMEDVRAADAIEARIARGEEHTYSHEEVWAEVATLEAQGALPD